MVPETAVVPKYPTLMVLLFLILAAVDMSTIALKRSGKAAILTNVSIPKGGHSSVHPDDIVMAMSRGGNPSSKKSMPSMVCFATGGFVTSGIEAKGWENFVVCPPEYLEDTGAALICHARLHQVGFNDLPDYIQHALLQLKHFKMSSAKVKGNLWFGLTSKMDGSATSENLVKESKFVDQTYIINQLRAIIKERKMVEATTASKKNVPDSLTINLSELNK
jgi:hypothetical protein